MKFIKSFYNKKQHFNNDNFNHTKSNSMKVKSTQRRKKFFSRKQQIVKKIKKFYLYNKSSHFAQNCRLKNPITSKKNKAMLKQKIDELKQDLLKKNFVKTNNLNFTSNGGHFHGKISAFQNKSNDQYSNQAMRLIEEIDQIKKKIRKYMFLSKKWLREITNKIKS